MSRTQEVLAATQQKQEAQQQASDGSALVPIDASDDGWSDAAAEADARWIRGTLALSSGCVSNIPVAMAAPHRSPSRWGRL
jgi:hypothetical protein